MRFKTLSQQAVDQQQKSAPKGQIKEKKKENKKENKKHTLLGFLFLTQEV